MYHTDNQLDILSIRAALDFQFWSAYLACISLTLVSTKQTKDMQRFQIEKSKSFIKDSNSLRHKPNVLANVQDAIRKLENGEKLHREHFLKGKLKGLKECHLQCGQLLVWIVEGSVLRMLRIGTHHQLFGL
jgi:mRNA interferase YafQ